MKPIDKIWKFWLSAMAVPIVVLVRLLRPILLIRFGELRSSRLGHFAANTEIYLCERDAGKQTLKRFDIFYYNGAISNYQLKKMWDRKLYVCNFAKWVDKINRLLPCSQNHIIPMSSSNDRKGFFRRMPPHLSFTPEEERKGQKELEKLRVPRHHLFICFYARNSDYLNTTHPGKMWDYHDYRDSNINNYLPAAEELTRRGYYAIRMGSHVKERLKTENPMIIDYANIARTDFSDVFLSAKCAFFICDTGGLSSLPWIFRRPKVWVNYIPLGFIGIGNTEDIYVPKKLWLKKEQRFLTLQEIINSEIGLLIETKRYQQAGIEIIENTPDEIKAAAIEMDERLKGNWKATEEDEKLQHIFKSLYKTIGLDSALISNIGTEFLHQNRKLLEGDTGLNVNVKVMV